MNYGLPYKGSKNKIAEWIVSHFPKAENFYDLFAGGCSVTHAALLSGKFNNIYANDLFVEYPRLFLSAINGEFKDETRWISRNDFEELKGSDAYVSSCWSFGNNCRNYLYSEEIEPYKKALHYACVFEDYSLFNAMGIYPKKSQKESSYERKIEIGNWLKSNSSEVKTKYINYWLDLVDDKRRDYERIYNIVVGGDTIKSFEDEKERLRNYLLNALSESGLKQRDVGDRLGTNMERHYFGKSQWSFPTFEQYKKMQEFMPLKEDYYELTNYYTILNRLKSLQSLQSLQSLERLKRLQSLQSLESLQRLQSLQSLESLQSLNISCASYENMSINVDSVVYCDIPYIGKDAYLSDFDHEKFYDWARNIGMPVYISEYQMPEDFVCIDSVKKRSLLSGKGSGELKDEKIFVHESQIGNIKRPKEKVYTQLKLF